MSARNGDILIEVKDLHKVFLEKLHALNGITTTIRKGEVVVIEESFGVRITEIINGLPVQQ